MSKTSRVYWFVEPEDSHTNKVIASQLLAISQFEESVAMEDSEGKEHSVYQIETHFFATRLYADRINLNLKFKVYYRAGMNGKLYPWKYGGQQSQTKPVVKKNLKK